MGISNTKILHMLEVAKIMEQTAIRLYPEDLDFARDMFSLGLLHDIGYEHCLEAKDHPKVGAELMKAQGYAYWREILFHGKSECEYSSVALDILNAADLLVNSKGEIIGVVERLRDIEERYGSESVQFKRASILSHKLFDKGILLETDFINTSIA